MSKAKEILESINMQKSNRGKSKETSGNKYQITLQRKKKAIKENDKLYKGDIYFLFNDNYFNNSDKETIIGSLFIDAETYLSCKDAKEFMEFFDYKHYTEAENIYNACKNNLDKIYKLFTFEEIEILREYFQNNY